MARGGGNKWPARPLVKTILRVPMHRPLYGHRSGMLCGVSELYSMLTLESRLPSYCDGSNQISILQQLHGGASVSAGAEILVQNHSDFSTTV